MIITIVIFKRQHAEQVLLLGLERNLRQGKHTKLGLPRFRNSWQEPPTFSPLEFSFPFVRLASRVLGLQPLVGSKFTALAGRVAYL